MCLWPLPRTELGLTREHISVASPVEATVLGGIIGYEVRDAGYPFGYCGKCLFTSIVNLLCLSLPSGSTGAAKFRVPNICSHWRRERVLEKLHRLSRRRVLEALSGARMRMVSNVDHLIPNQVNVCVGSILDLGRFMSQPISSKTWMVVLTLAAVCSLEASRRCTLKKLRPSLPGGLPPLLSVW